MGLERFFPRAERRREVPPSPPELSHAEPADEGGHHTAHEAGTETVEARADAAPAVSARVAANRANARRSTGPRTPEGKAKSRANAVKHGLYVRHLELAAKVLEDDREELAALEADLYARYRPQGVEEEWIVDRLAATWWDLARLHRYSQADIAQRIEEYEQDPFFALCEVQDTIGKAEARLERSLTRMRKDLAFLQRYRPPEPERACDEAPPEPITHAVDPPEQAPVDAPPAAAAAAGEPAETAKVPSLMSPPSGPLPAPDLEAQARAIWARDREALMKRMVGYSPSDQSAAGKT